VTAWFPRITLHSLAIMLALLTYVLTTRLERERRPPSVAISWVFAMIALPYLALPMYVCSDAASCLAKSRLASPDPRARRTGRSP
jgi:predicted PurR-regulated permease PerM